MVFMPAWVNDFHTEHPDHPSPRPRERQKIEHQEVFCLLVYDQLLSFGLLSIMDLCLSD